MEDRNLAQDVSDVLTSLDQIAKAEKLPSALFDRLLAALFETDGCDTLWLADFDIDKFAKENVNADQSYFVRFLVHIFGATHNPQNYPKTAEIFLKSAGFSLYNVSFASSWLRACRYLASDSNSRLWLHHNGYTTHILTLLKHNNMYVSRNAAAVVAELLQFNVSDKDRVMDLLTVLLGAIIQYDYTKRGLSSHSPRFSEMVKDHSVKVSENVSVECARLVVEFTERLHKDSFDPSQIRNMFNISLSQEEAKALINLASNYRRMQDCCLAIYCVFYPNTELGSLTDDISSRIAFRNIKIADLLKRDGGEDNWFLALNPLQVNKSDIPAYLPSYALAVSDFLRTCNQEFVNKELILRTCAGITSVLKDNLMHERVLSSLLKFVTSATKVVLTSDNVTASFDFCITDRILDSIESPQTNDPNFLVAQVRAFATIMSNVLQFSGQVGFAVWKQLKHFLYVCNEIQRFKESSPTVRFATVEAVRSLIMATKRVRSGFTKDELFLHYIDALKVWALLVAETITRLASSDLNFGEVVGAYAYASCFDAFAKLLSFEIVLNDTGFVNQILDLISLNNLGQPMSLAFPAVRRSVIAFVFTIAHTSRDLHATADNMLMEVAKSTSDEPDQFVVGILRTWESNCLRHQETTCQHLASLNEDTLEFSRNGDNSKLDPTTVAHLVCGDVLAFLHSSDDMPCVLIGAPDDVDIDVIDCEES